MRPDVPSSVAVSLSGPYASADLAAGAKLRAPDFEHSQWTSCGQHFVCQSMYLLCNAAHVADGPYHALLPSCVVGLS